MKTEPLPTHLTCPYCPAQAVRSADNPKGIHFLFENVQFPDKLHLAKYVCPARHEFWIEGREHAPDTDRVL
jgi:hypothetical protein